ESVVRAEREAEHAEAGHDLPGRGRIGLVIREQEPDRARNAAARGKRRDRTRRKTERKRAHTVKLRDGNDEAEVRADGEENGCRPCFHINLPQRGCKGVRTTTSKSHRTPQAN